MFSLSQYIFVLDALNFCFWPLPGYEYDTLASSLKRELEADSKAFDAHRLATMTPSKLQNILMRTFLGKEMEMELGMEMAGEVVPFPLLEERARLLRELGTVLENEYDGFAINLVKEANHNAEILVDLIVEKLPGFR